MEVWFGSIDVGQAPAAVRRVFDEICRLLDRLDPKNLDPARQTASFSGRDLWVHLVHREAEDADVNLVITERWTNFYGPFGHDEAYEGVRGDDWEAETVEILAKILTSHYEVETQLWHDQPYRTLTTAIHGDDRELTTSYAPRGLLPHRASSLTRTHRNFDYGCRGEETINP